MPQSLNTAVWIRCGRPGDADIAASLASRIDTGGTTTTVVEVTGPGCSAKHPEGEEGLALFLNEQGISGVIWLGGRLDSATLRICAKANVPVSALAVNFADIPPPQRPRLLRRHVSQIAGLSHAMVHDEETRDALIRLGMPEKQIELVTQLQADHPILPHDEDERMRIAGLLRNRPTWCAAGASLRDVDNISDAHRIAARTAHRLLTIVVPITDPLEVAQAFRARGFGVAELFQGDDPEEATEIYVADGMDDLGLWYRLAPISFICGSCDNGARVDPFDPATLGSAIISGAASGKFSTHFDRLTRDAALMPIFNANDLGPAVVRLLSAGHAANMALAGWSVTTDGSAHINRVADRIKQVLTTGIPA